MVHFTSKKDLSCKFSLPYQYHMMTTPANTARMHVTLIPKYCDHPSTIAAAMIDQESLNTAGITNKDAPKTHSLVQ